MTVYFSALGLLLALAVVSWLVSIKLKDVSFVDSLWSLFFLVAAFVFSLGVEQVSARGFLLLSLVAIWSIRLSLHITVRNWGQPEDYRYRTIRANNEPGFTFKSLYIVFALQGVLAWIISAPLLPAMAGTSPLGVIDLIAASLWAFGFYFEAVGDFQLQRFKSDPSNKGKVMDRGLWGLSRHPNYFGEFCIWWGFWLFAVAAGAWWTVFAPLLISFLLLKVSGVAMLEKTIEERRPRYADYVRSTNAFFPGPRRADSSVSE